MPKIQTAFSGLVTLLARNLYTSPDVFIRELLQNAHDGCQRASQGLSPGQFRIDLTSSFVERQISFADNGIGMDETDIHEYLSTIGRSGTATETGLLGAAGLSVETIGQFGVGLLSAFVVAERIDVFTRKAGRSTGYHWVSHGGEDYELSPTPDCPEQGTEITLTLKPEFAQLLNEEGLAKAIHLYADFLPVPIYLNGNGPVNVRRAPWHLDVWTSPRHEEEACERFLAQRYPDSALLVIPLKLTNPRARGVLYITDQPIPGIGSSGQLDLYVRGMCIRLGDPDLLPSWATFVRGIADADLQPTAARDNVQRDTAYHRFRQGLAASIVRAMLELHERDPDRFQRLCAWHQVGIKGMALREESFFRAVVSHLPFHTNQGTLALAEVVRRQKALPNGRKPLYYFSSTGGEAQFFQLCRANGLLAINAGRVFDEQVLQRFAQWQHEDVELRRMDHLDSTQLYLKLDPAEEARYEPLLAALAEELSAVDLSRARPVIREIDPPSLTSVLLEPASSEALDRFQFLIDSPAAPASVRALAADFTARLAAEPHELILNARNPLVQSLRDFPAFDDGQVRHLLVGLYHCALLQSQRRFNPEVAHLSAGYLQEQLLASSLACRRTRTGSAPPSESTASGAANDLTHAPDHQNGSLPRSSVDCTSLAAFRRSVQTATDTELTAIMVRLAGGAHVPEP